MLKKAKKIRTIKKEARAFVVFLLFLNLSLSSFLSGCANNKNERMANDAQTNQSRTESDSLNQGESEKNDTSDQDRIERKAVTFTDDLGREVTVDSPKRVATLLGSFADVWYLAGGEIVAAPDDAWEDFDLPLAEDVVNLGNTKDLSLELLFSAEPDFILASSNTRVDLDWLDTLEDAEIPTAYFDVANFDDYLRMLKVCTDLTGRSDLYEENGLNVQKKIDEVLEPSQIRIEKNGVPSVLSLRASASSVRAKNSKGNVLGELLAALGCENIADREESLLEDLSIEYIIKCDPDYIFIVQQGDDTEGTKKNIEQFIAEHPAWEGLTAVKEGRVVYLDKALYGLKPNARWGEAYENLEQILSGEADISIQNQN